MLVVSFIIHEVIINLLHILSQCILILYICQDRVREKGRDLTFKHGSSVSVADWSKTPACNTKLKVAGSNPAGDRQFYFYCVAFSKFQIAWRSPLK